MTECINTVGGSSFGVDFVVTITNQFTANPGVQGGGFLDQFGAIVANGNSFQGLINGDRIASSGSFTQTLNRAIHVPCIGGQATITLSGTTSRFIPSRNAPGRLTYQAATDFTRAAFCAIQPDPCTDPRRCLIEEAIP